MSEPTAPAVPHRVPLCPLPEVYGAYIGARGPARARKSLAMDDQADDVEGLFQVDEAAHADDAAEYVIRPIVRRHPTRPAWVQALIHDRES